MNTKIKIRVVLIKSLITLTFIINGTIGNAQIDSTKLIGTCKIHVLYDRCNGIFNIDSINQDTFYQTAFLKSEGFENIVFVAVRIKELPNILIDKSNRTPFSCEYVIGYDVLKNYIYHLKGFRNNDFERFYKNNIPREYKSSVNIKLLKKEALSDFQIEGIDLNCLYRVYIEKNNKLKACCISCVERDGRYAVFQ